MKKNKSLLIPVLLVLMVFAVNGQTAKPRPPRSLRYISENIRTLEEAHDEGEYDEALESVLKMKESLGNIANEINASGAGGKLTELLSYLADYESALKQKRPDSEEFEDARIDISMALFSIMDVYSYRTPPLLDFISRQFDELKEEIFEEGEWEGAEDELEEIEEFWEEILGNYSSYNGVTAVGKEVEKAMGELGEAIEKEHADQVVDSVQVIQGLIDDVADLITG